MSTPLTKEQELRHALTLCVASLDQLLPYLAKVPADVGLVNDALTAARPLLKEAPAEPAQAQDERECCCPKIGEPWNPEKHGRDCPAHQAKRPRAPHHQESSHANLHPHTRA